MGDVEAQKLRQHLTLLKEEYAKLQQNYQKLLSKYNSVIAMSTTGDSGANSGDNFACRLMSIVKNLYMSDKYGDLIVRLQNGDVVKAHKIVMSARSNLWNLDIAELDWSDFDVLTARAILHWIYTGDVTFDSDNEDLSLKLLLKAHDFRLDELKDHCQMSLIRTVNERNCVKFYSIAEKAEAENLRSYASNLISLHWYDLDADDFREMSGPALYGMFKDKTKFPLHSAVKFQREDVVFLCLVEHSSQVSDLVNTWSDVDELPLELALVNKNVTIATTLIQHGADVNICDRTGDALVHRALKKYAPFTVLFLLDNRCDVNKVTTCQKDSALHLIAGATSFEDDVKITRKILESHVDVNVQNLQGFTPLQVSIQADNLEIFDVLLEQPAIDVNVKTNNEHCALYFALLHYHSTEDDGYVSRLTQHGAITDVIYKRQNDASLLQILIKEGADIAARYFVCNCSMSNVDHMMSDEVGESALHQVCARNYVELTRHLAEKGADPNVTTRDTKLTPVHYAVIKGAKETLEYLSTLTGGRVNFNPRDVNGDTPLTLAVNRGSVELVPILIAGGADVNVRNNKDLTLLHQAILKEDETMAIFLLENGADINAKTADSETPLQLAIHCRLGEVVEALCIRGVDMSSLDNAGSCPLWAALDSGQDDIAAILVKHGADTDCWGAGPDNCRQTLLHRAIDENKDVAAIFLIQAGCDLDSPRMPGPEGEGGEEATDKASPLHLCCQWGLVPVVRTLIEHRANVNSRDCQSKTPIHVAIENQHPEIIALLLSVPEIDLTLRDRNGLSPFAAALTVRNIKAAQSILDKYPQAAEQFDTKGQNFLHIAIKKGDIESALFLLTVNVDVNSRVQDPMLTPPLHLAAKHATETLIRSLILAGARVDDRDNQKRTALHVAAESGNAPAVVSLVQNNCDFDALDVENNNALHIAVKEGHLSVIRALLTESTIDAEAVNLKGRNPLHELCRYGKDNAAAICELFLECMPAYPINKTDLNGNSPLLLAYMKGNGNLCRSLVKANACLATENNERVTIFNYQVASKQLLNRLLDQLSQPATWTNTDSCQECGKSFSITVRTHHCRHCGRALCSKCSDQEVPIIKFGENKPLRVCKVCFEVLKTGGGSG